MELRTMIAQNNKTTVMKTAVLTLALLAFVGCQSKQDKAIEQAKKQAAATGQAQQVTTTVTPAAAVGGVPANTPAGAGGQPVAQQATVMVNGQPEVPTSAT